MIAILAEEGFFLNHFEKLLDKHEIEFQRVNDAPALIAQDWDIIFTEPKLVSKDAMAAISDDLVLIAIGVENADAPYDAAFPYPIEWDDISEFLTPPQNGFFDENIRSQTEELLGESYGEALTQVIEDMEALQKDLRNAELAEQALMVHRVSGVAAMLGLSRLHKNMLSIELLAKSGDEAGTKSELMSLWENWPEYKSQIEDVI